MRLFSPPLPATSVLILSAATVPFLGCSGDGPSGPPPVTSVVVTSPIEDVMAVGRSVQLSAVANDDAGDAISGRSFSWESSDESVATVNETGVVQGLADGSARISAETGDVSGTLDMTVVAAELQTVSGLLDDSFTSRLSAGLTPSVRDAVQTSLTACQDALDEGYLLDLRDCLQDAASTSTSDATDVALLAVLETITLRAELSLNL